MDANTKKRALRLLRDKMGGKKVTYSEISLETGYSKRQLIRLAHRLEDEGEEAVLAHGNSGARPHNASTEEEVRYLRRLKEPYPNVTIAHFRDIYIEDVLENPAKADDVERYGLVMRGATWFRSLFEREGWVSPAARGPRRDSGGRQHPTRKPLPRLGMMAQIDGTPYDWFGDGRSWCMHLAVDDATTRVLGGWFMEHECLRGYARMMREVVTRHGIPRSLYSDKDSVFRSARRGTPSQFALMVRDLGSRMIYANSPQAKGRVERYNGTAQLRLPTDLIRFGVTGYEAINAWSDDFYAPYPDSKFSYRPLDPRNDFMPLPEELDLTEVFRTRETRDARGCTISYQNTIYAMVDADGVLLEVPDDTRLDVHIDVMTEEMYVERQGRRWACVPLETRKVYSPIWARDRRALQRKLDEMQMENGARGR